MTLYSDFSFGGEFGKGLVLYADKKHLEGKDFEEVLDFSAGPFVNFMYSEIDYDLIVAIAETLKIKINKKDVRKDVEKNPHDAILKHCGDDFAPAIAKKLGKVGYVYNKSKGERANYVVLDKEYVSDKSYREKTNKKGTIPSFKERKRYGEIIDLDKRLAETKSRQNVIKQNGSLKKNYLALAEKLHKEGKINKQAFIDSIKRIKKEAKSKPQEDALIKESFDRALVLAELDKIEKEYEDAKVRMLGSPAHEPRTSHQLYAGKIVSMAKAMKLKKEYGCKCLIQIVENKKKAA